MVPGSNPGGPILKVILGVLMGKDNNICQYQNQNLLFHPPFLEKNIPKLNKYKKIKIRRQK
jgi:hypothetical protein